MKATTSAKTTLEALTDEMASPRIASSALASIAALQKDMRPTIRILVADDHPTILEMVKKILKAHAGYEVVGEARDGQDAVSLAESLKPDVIVIKRYDA